MKGHIATSESDLAAATLSTTSGQGLLHSRKHFVPSTKTTMEHPKRNIAAGYRPFSRRVGLRYSAQVLLNSLPLLLADIFTLTATIIASRLLFYYLKWPVGIDVTACLVPITV